MCHTGQISKGGCLQLRPGVFGGHRVGSGRHGLAMLLLEGPLRHVTGHDRDVLVREVLAFAGRGL